MGWVELRKWARDEKQIDGDLMGIRIIYSIPCQYLFCTCPALHSYIVSVVVGYLWFEMLLFI